MTLAINNLDEVAPTFTSGAAADGDRRKQRRGPGGLHRGGDRPETDGGPSNPVSYTLRRHRCGAFTIDATTGAVTLTGNPDFETRRATAST